MGIHLPDFPISTLCSEAALRLYPKKSNIIIAIVLFLYYYIVLLILSAARKRKKYFADGVLFFSNKNMINFPTSLWECFYLHD